MLFFLSGGEPSWTVCSYSPRVVSPLECPEIGRDIQRETSTFPKSNLFVSGRESLQCLQKSVVSSVLHLDVLISTRMNDVGFL